jgi:prevent-host-death family protein
MPTQIDITQPTQPLDTFRDHSADFIAHLNRTRRPIMLTVNGEPAVVLQDAASYQRLLDLAAAADAHEGIRQGLDQLKQGLGRPASEFFDYMRAKYAIPR